MCAAGVAGVSKLSFSLQISQNPRKTAVFQIFQIFKSKKRFSHP
jgi:hypothetical protein